MKVVNACYSLSLYPLNFNELKIHPSSFPPFPNPTFPLNCAANHIQYVHSRNQAAGVEGLDR